MIVTEEPPLPRTGPWAVVPGLQLGVIGTSGVGVRLAQHVGVLAVEPRDEPEEVVREVDALLVESSAFEDATGPWAHALRPVGFDRGTALARLLAAARSGGRPVLGVDDLPDRPRSPWLDVLGASLDDVARLGVVAHGALTWHPGVHWSAAALGSATTTTAPTPAPGAPFPRTAVRDWAVRQARAVADGTFVVDPGDPWDVVFAAEVTALGVEVRRPDGVWAPSALSARPSTALAALCSRLSLPVPMAAPLLVLRPADDDVATRLRAADARAVVVVAAVEEPEDADVAACRDALDRARNVAAVRLAGDRLVATRASTLRELVVTTPADTMTLHRWISGIAAPRVVA